MVDLIKLKALSKVCASYQKTPTFGKALVLSLLSGVGILPATESRGRKTCLENLIESIHILLPHQRVPDALKHEL